MAERFLYAPAMAFVACAVAAAAWILRRAPVGWVRVLVVVTVAALGARTFARNFDWKDDASLWQSAVAASPNSYKTHATLAKISRNVSLPEIDKALAILDGLPDASNVSSPYSTAGAVYRMEGDRLHNAESLKWYRKSEAVLLRGRRIQELQYAQAVRNSGNQPAGLLLSASSPIYSELGKTWMQLSEFTKAAEIFRTNVDLQPTTGGFLELSAAYYKAGDSAQAAIALFEAVATDPGQSVIGGQLAALYQQIDPGGCALDRLPNGESSLNLDCPLVHGHACAAFENVVARHRLLLRPRAAAETAAYAVNSLKCGPASFQPR